MFRDDFDDEYHEDLDDQFRMERDAEGDDFANFDPQRYLRRRYGERPYLDGDREETDLDHRRQYGEAPDSAPDYGDRYRSGRSRWRRSRPRARQSIANSVEKGSGLLALIFSGADPVLQIAIVGIGCFGVLFCLGTCGILIWFLNLLLSR